MARETKYIDSFILAQVKIGMNFEILIIKIAVSISLYEAIAYFFIFQPLPDGLHKLGHDSPVAVWAL